MPAESTPAGGDRVRPFATTGRAIDLVRGGCLLHDIGVYRLYDLAGVDKFYSKTNPPVFLTAAAYRERLRRFGDDNMRLFDAMVERFGEPDLKPLAYEYGDAGA